MSSGITDRIERELGIAGLVDALAGRLPASDLRSLLLAVYQRRSAESKEAAIRDHATRDPLMAPSAVGAREFAAFDSIAFQAAAGFEAMDLSPVCPFAASAKLGGTSQNNVLTTIRNAEVLGDPTIALALEASRRRSSSDLVRLCASHRVIRLQPFDVPGYSPHFRLFALVTAGRDTGSSRFETASLMEHVRIYLRMFRLLNDAGFALHHPLVEFADMRTVATVLETAGITREQVRESIRAHQIGGSERLLGERALSDAPPSKIETEVMAALHGEFPEAEFLVNHRRLEGFGYYDGFTLRISPQAPNGTRYPIVDGGFTDWTARLRGSRKERLLISGIGSEFVLKTYMK